MARLNSPLHIQVGTHKYALNFNRTRNLHGFVWGKMKDNYTTLMLPVVKQLPVYTGKVQIQYILYTGSKRKSDVMNWVAVVDKFFQDVLVKAKKIQDDNYEYVPKVIGVYGGYDKNNPRMEIVIQEL